MSDRLSTKLKGIKGELDSLKEKYSTSKPPSVLSFNDYIKRITLLTDNKLASNSFYTKLRACRVDSSPVYKSEITKLIKVLESGNEKQQLKEAQDQQQEMQKYITKGGLIRRPVEDIEMTI